MYVHLCSMRRQKKVGFSLIELLVAISIAGVLFTLVFVNFQRSRQQTREEVLQTVLLDLQLALEQYRLQHGRYPEVGCSSADPNVVWFTQGAGSPNINDGVNFLSTRCTVPFIRGLAPDFIPSLPIGQNVFYRTNTDGSAYKLVAFRVIDVARVQNNGDKFSVCPTQCGSGTPPMCGSAVVLRESYGAYSPGAECW
jgi:prepilin-type N-terminal cleavage/methylation domain-containing protein